MPLYLLRAREEVVFFIEKQFTESMPTDREKGDKVHYGQQELRQLLDYIYVIQPKNKQQELHVRTMQCDSRPEKQNSGS